MTPDEASQLTLRQQLHRIPYYPAEALSRSQDFSSYISMSKKSRKMISHPDDSDDGLLGESTYEILSDLSIPSHSDDDDDDLSSLASLAEDTADEDEEGEGDEQEFLFPSPNSEVPKESANEDLQSSTYPESVPDVPDTFESAGIPSYTGLDQHEPPTVHNVVSEESLSDVTIRFDEKPVPLGPQFTLAHDLQEFTGEEFKEVLASSSAPEDVKNLYSLLRCSLAVDPLGVKDTFRVLYVGDESAKDEIFRKIGAALVVSTSYESLEDSKSSARFNVVPVTSFGNSASTPDVELVESFGLEMAVDTCAFAYPSNDDTDLDTLSLVIKPRMLVRSRKAGAGYKLDKLEAPGWRLPDLAIFYCEANDDARQRATRSCARSFLSRHGVPFIFISDKKLYKSTEEFDIDFHALHIAIETRKTTEDGKRLREVYKELPVDMHSFINVDVQQLSRNLAIIVKQRDEDEDRSMMKSMTIWDKVQEIIEAFEGRTQDQAFNVGIVIVAGLILSTICLALSVVFVSFLKPSNVQLENSTTLISPIQNSLTTKAQVSTSLSVYTSTSTTSLSVAKSKSPSTTSAKSKSSTSSPPKVLPRAPSSIMTAGIKSLSVTDIPSLPANGSNEFAMYTISDGHIVLRAPTKFASLRWHPKLIVHVKRKNHTVPVEVVTLFRGVYAVKMDLSEAWGILNITVKTESKPIINQSFILDLGNPWLSTMAWKRSMLATSSDLRKAVNKASSKANVYAQKIQETSKQQINMCKKEVRYLQTEAVKLQQELSKQSKVAKKTVESQLRLWKNGFDDLKIDNYFDRKSLKKYEDQLKEQVKKARKNASRLWVRTRASKRIARKRALKVSRNSVSCGKKGKRGKAGKCKNSR
ncbi:hypothetical protein TWF788_004914 [Orbilia oligospora]|uniref:Uncharacterized protein n=1 Tax=Orbilia oligospora TaxID=2813651 RepID=A0A7C8PHG5_ORBOL|nr:hypothetical protein TWF788_004914 [Orbilia oligospora]